MQCSAGPTPSQLINGRNLSFLPHDRYYEMISTYESMLKPARHFKILLHQFIKKWRKEYLTGLIEL